ncbi:MAG: pseudaminic acid cytidylyltransferase [Bacteroidales bacterium]|jgi:N-acylneuraminate cytidylyltransferase|nr:pseudaminic acid cytidylyltransferase [Bacteroidales bacterium]
MEKKVAIITARGGSKRIPKKNIRPFLGKPIIAYSIESALASGLFDEIMVSTDDEEIAMVSEKYGASIPFLRDPSTADDHATTVDALLDVFSSYSQRNKFFTYACCLYPTAVFTTKERLHQAFDEMIRKKFDVVYPVMKYTYPIWRSLKIEDGRLVMNWPEHINRRSQDLPESFHDAGQFYFFQVNTFLKEKKLFGNNSGGIFIDETEGQDIDNITDWKLAELKYKLLYHL